MKKKPWLSTHRLELAVGLFVAAGLVALLMLSIKVSNLSNFSSGDSYTVTASFDNVGGLKVKSPVSAGGVRIGRVTDIEYDQNSYQSVVTMKIDATYDRLPDDSSASILTAGLLGENYVGIEPGGSDMWLKDGSEIDLTQSALVLEQIVGQFIFNKSNDGAGNSVPAQGAANAVAEPTGSQANPFAAAAAPSGSPWQAAPGGHPGGSMPPAQAAPPGRAPPGPYQSQGEHRWGGMPPEGMSGPDSPVANQPEYPGPGAKGTNTRPADKSSAGSKSGAAGPSSPVSDGDKPSELL